MLKLTFLDLARQWKYQGFNKIDLHFQEHVKNYLDTETFITTVERLLTRDIHEAEGYMAVTLEYAEVENVVKYTIGGGHGR